MPLAIEQKTLGDFTVFTLMGELLVSSMQKLKDAFQDCMATGKLDFAIDFSTATHIDSSGIGLLSNVRKKVDAANGQLVLYSLPSHILASLEQIGLKDNFTIVSDETEFQNTFIL